MYKTHYEETESGFYIKTQLKTFRRPVEGKLAWEDQIYVHQWAGLKVGGRTSPGLEDIVWEPTFFDGKKLGEALEYYEYLVREQPHREEYQSKVSCVAGAIGIISEGLQDIFY